MKDIVIPLINSYNQDQELIYALRSAEKFHGGELDQVWVIGDKPKVNLDVNFIPFPQPKFAIDPNRDMYMFKKILLATAHCNEDFFIWHDDNFLLGPIEAYYHQGDLWRGSPDSNYWHLEQNTKAIFPSTLNYDVHSPHLVSVTGFKKLLKLNWNIPNGYGIKTAYANLNNVGTTLEVVDCKIAGGFVTTWIEEKISDKKFFSISDTALTPTMRGVLNKLYPNKSKWEV